ncbi:hypothetical protein Nepgr_007364 [Nepenthes gracilis]|uniref:Uncharacterized protein n=1 Tax=Nepenthes gracilis TaxID=150966 RepID=A0AAD3S6Z7_NEPGR|nr:hypothetical protein Nepgr_007364 [Nepenthes gracilis]
MLNIGSNGLVYSPPFSPRTVKHFSLAESTLDEFLTFMVAYAATDTECQMNHLKWFSAGGGFPYLGVIIGLEVTSFNFELAA